MLLQKNKSCLLLVDVQEKLTQHVMHADDLVLRCQWLMRLAIELDVPIIVSEQYSRGLGHTVAPLRALMSQESDIDKVHFSCLRDQTFANSWRNINRKQALIAGIETHVCVLQTALDLKSDGFDVFVAVDAVSSRREVDHQYALSRMQQAGIQLVTTEMVFFEWVELAGTPVFKALSQTFIQEKGA